MGVLESLLKFKAEKEAQQSADIQAIPQALMAFQAGRQQQQDNLLKQLTIQANLAGNGLRLENKNGNYGIVKDESLRSQKDLLDEQLKQAQVNYYNNIIPQVVGQQDPNNPTGFGTFVSGTSNRGIPTLKTDSPVDVANRASNLRKELIGNPVIKDYQEISSRVSTLDSLLKQANEGDNKSLGTLDQALVTTFNKITDPQSVVRESEYARTPEGGSVLSRFEGNIQKLQKGGAGLTPELRTQLVSDAKLIADGVGQNYNQIISSYEDLAGQYKVDPKMVLGSLKKHNGFKSNESNSEESNKVGKFKIISVN